MGYLQETIQTRLNIAHRYKALYERGVARLTRYPLWRRIVFYPYFSKLRAKVAHFRWLMAANTMMALAMVRTNKRQDRESRNRNSQRLSSQD